MPVRRACVRPTERRPANRPKLHKRRGSGSFRKKRSIYEEKVGVARGVGDSSEQSQDDRGAAGGGLLGGDVEVLARLGAAQV